MDLIQIIRTANSFVVFSMAATETAPPAPAGSSFDQTVKSISVPVVNVMAILLCQPN